MGWGRDAVRQVRRAQYASGVAALQDDVRAVGADAIFDAALTNGLMAVAAGSISGHVAGAGSDSGSLPSARGVLRDLTAAFGADEVGRVYVPTGENAWDVDMRGVRVDLGHELLVVVDVALLDDAVRRTQPPRHARGRTGSLTVGDVAALAALDEHPALRVLSDFRTDEYWVRGAEADAIETARASEFFAMLSVSDAEERVEAVAASRGWPADETELQECPVCGNRSLVATSSDGWGYGIVAGTCPVCSYRQSEHAAERANHDAEWDARWKHL